MKLVSNYAFFFLSNPWPITESPSLILLWVFRARHIHLILLAFSISCNCNLENSSTSSFVPWYLSDRRSMAASMLWWHRDIFRQHMPQPETKYHIDSNESHKSRRTLKTENVRVLIIILHFSSAFYLSSAISHPRFIFHPPFLIRVLSFIRHFLIRHPYPPSVWTYNQPRSRIES